MPSFGEACRSYRGSLWLLRKAGGLDGLASSSSHYTCEKLLAASRPIPARRDWRLLGATSARFEQALWGEYLPEPPESTPTPHRSPSQGLAEDTVAGAQQACAPLIARRWCWPRRAWGKCKRPAPARIIKGPCKLPSSHGRAMAAGGEGLGRELYLLPTRPRPAQPEKKKAKLLRCWVGQPGTRTHSAAPIRLCVHLHGWSSLPSPP